MSLKDLPKDLISAATAILKKDQAITEKAPPDPILEKWTNDPEVQASFQRQYGSSWKEKVYATAWSKYKTNESKQINEACEDDEMLQKHDELNKQTGLPELGEDKKEDEEVKGPPWAKGMAAAAAEGREYHEAMTQVADELQEQLPEGESVQENYASPEPCSAVGRREGPEQPKHADVVYDCSRVGTNTFEGYRLLVQWPNKRCEFIPSADLNPAPTIESLKALTSGIVDEHNVISDAIATAQVLPHNDPHFSGK